MTPRPRIRSGVSSTQPPAAASPTDLKAKIGALPALPGVYIFKSARGEVLYVGKAKRLDQRVRSHFQSPETVGPKQVALIRRVFDLDFIAVDSEADALMLEATLVREHRPHYNIILKDDKRYPYIRVSWQEPFPRMALVRRLARDGARYFGPYTEVKALRQLLRMTQTIFPMRQCRDIDAHIAARRECLDYHIGRCAGPCIGAQSQEEYRAMVDHFCDFLAGRRDEVVARLRGMQEESAERREYERAARLRDQIRGIQSILARQRMVDISGAAVDVVGIARDGANACAAILKVRERRVVSRDLRAIQGALDADEAELLRAFLAQYYTRADQVPERLIVEAEPGERPLLEAFLSQAAGARVSVRTPRDTAERSLVRTARRNASLLLGDGPERGGGRQPSAEARDEALDLQRGLSLPALPRRIRCFDVSTIQGSHTVASMVTFRDGAPLKGEYRRFRIDSVAGQDDFASMAEAVRRHAARVARNELSAADLIVVDGGKGQLEAARRAVRGSVLDGVPIVGLAKRLEEVYLPGKRETLRLSRRSPALKLLMRLRDEAHRFAVGYHRVLRGKAARASALEAIPGLGPKRRALLLQRFGSVERLKRQPVGAIASVPGIGPRMAARIAERVGKGGGGQA